MSLKKFASFVSKVTIEVGWNFFECLPWIVTLQNYKMNASLYLRCIRPSFFKARADTLPGEANNGQFLVRQL